MTKHALLSASSSKRWLTCTPSARLGEPYTQPPSDFAEEGTLAHELAELKLRKAFLEPMTMREFNLAKRKIEVEQARHPNWDRAMDKLTDLYVEFVQTIVHEQTVTPYVAIERTVDYSAYAPEGFGTTDCIVIAGREMWINDLKFGKGVAVSAVNNSQMRLYALGAIAQYGRLYPIQRIHMAIVQPRLDDISRETLHLPDLLAWGESIKPKAARAFAGDGEFVPGEHCRFCTAKRVCPLRNDYPEYMGARNAGAAEDFKEEPNHA